MAGFSKHQKFRFGEPQPPAAHGWICELCHGDRFETMGEDYKFYARCARCRGEFEVGIDNTLKRLMPTKPVFQGIDTGVPAEELAKRNRFRKKPVEVEAHVFEPSEAILTSLARMDAEDMEEAGLHWYCFHNLVLKSFRIRRDTRGIHISIPTLEGPMRANLGDWIIFGIKGEPYPCKPDIFALTYEAVP